VVAQPQPLPLLEDVTAPRVSPNRARVALIVMPFAPSNRPSIQCGLLKADLVRCGYAVDVHYLNLQAAIAFGAERYQTISDSYTEEILGEWLFSVAAFGDHGDEEAYRAACPSVDTYCQTLGLTFEELCDYRKTVIPALVAHWRAAIDWSVYTAVGFSSTFQQHVASLALARQIKEQHPQVAIIFGGANVEGEMGPAFMRAFPWLDYTVSGEGDVALPALMARIANGESGVGVPGVSGRVNGAVIDGGLAPRVERLDDLPLPDYDEYFAALERLGAPQVLGSQEVRLNFESSRGCWWGEKHHCTFCGLNGLGMVYRSRRPEQVLDDLRVLSDRYGVLAYISVDNILDMHHIEGLLGPLGDGHYDYRIYHEVKANLTRAQLHILRRAGIVQIQAGIESLNTHVLALMRKGTTMLRNVRFLKWCEYYGFRVEWNLLMGFPGETLADYDEQVRLIPLLYHLTAPSNWGAVVLDRFSPYFEDPSFPVRAVRPFAAYRFLYPVEGLDLNKAAHAFECDWGDTVPLAEREPLMVAAREWDARRGRQPAPTLAYERAPDWLRILDRRDPASPRVLVLRGLEAAVYEACTETDHTAARVAEQLQQSGAAITAADVERMLLRLCELEVMLEEDGHFLSLALPANRAW
jgi:ribosomal peptide maturation radical SAM protein 1